MSFIVTAYPKRSADYITCFATRDDALAFMATCDHICAMTPVGKDAEPDAPKDVLNSNFSRRDYAEQALRGEGFEQLELANQVWRSRDGLVDATIKQRFSDGRFYIVVFA